MFGNIKSKPGWTDKTAPKKAPLSINMEVRLYRSETYSSTDIAMSNVRELLITSTDSTKKEIKDELAEKLEQLYDRLCYIIDMDENNITSNYWLNKQIESAKENNV